MSQHYQTRNTALALALHTAGVPWAQAGEDSLPPILNIYDAQLLRDRGYKGLALEAAAQHAVEHGVSGHVVYQFQRCTLLEQVIKGFDAQNKVIREAQDGPTPTTMMITPEELGAIAAQLLHNRKALLESWRTAPAFLALSGPVRTSKETTEKGEATFLVGSFQVVPLNASPETRSALGIQ